MSHDDHKHLAQLATAEAAAPAAAAAAAPARSGSNKDKNRTPQVATAAFLVKGAAAKIINTYLTIGTQFDSKVRGRLTVEYKGEKPPTEDQRSSMEEQANRKVKDNLFVEVSEMDRQAADEQFTKSPVNCQNIYEKRKPGDAVTKLNILQIADWTVACVASTEFMKKTGEVGPIKIVKFNHRPQKSELEIMFEITEDVANGIAPSTAGGGSAATGKPGAAAASLTLAPTTNDNVAMIAAKIEKMYTDAFAGGKTPSDTEMVRMRAATEQMLTSMKNTAYATGFAAKLK